MAALNILSQPPNYSFHNFKIKNCFDNGAPCCKLHSCSSSSPSHFNSLLSLYGPNKPNSSPVAMHFSKSGKFHFFFIHSLRKFIYFACHFNLNQKCKDAFFFFPFVKFFFGTNCAHSDANKSCKTKKNQFFSFVYLSIYFHGSKDISQLFQVMRNCLINIIRIVSFFPRWLYWCLLYPNQTHH